MFEFGASHINYVRTVTMTTYRIHAAFKMKFVCQEELLVWCLKIVVGDNTSNFSGLIKYKYLIL